MAKAKQMMKQVFVVITHDNREYHNMKVRAVCTTKRAAKKHVEALVATDEVRDASNCTITRMEVNASPPAFTHGWDITLTKDGILQGAQQRTIHCYEYIPMVYWNRYDAFCGWVKADSEEEAIELMQERRKDIIESGSWGNMHDVRNLMETNKWTENQARAER